VVAEWADRGTAPAVQGRDSDWEVAEDRAAREPVAAELAGAVALAREEAAGPAARACGNRVAGRVVAVAQGLVVQVVVELVVGVDQELGAVAEAGLVVVGVDQDLGGAAEALEAAGELEESVAGEEPAGALQRQVASPFRRENG
jgi:hypothetical protein